MIQFFIVTAVVVSIAGALGNISYFSGSFAFGQAQQALAFMDYAGMFLSVGFFVVSVGLAALSRNNKVFMPVSVVFLTVSVLVSAILSDTWLALVSQGALSGAASSLPLINLVASNMPLFIGTMGLIVISATYTSLGGGRRAPR